MEKLRAMFRRIIFYFSVGLILVTLYANILGVLTFQNNMSLELSIKVFLRLGFNLLPFYLLGVALLTFSYENKKNTDKQEGK